MSEAPVLEVEDLVKHYPAKDGGPRTGGMPALGAFRQCGLRR